MEMAITTFVFFGIAAVLVLRQHRARRSAAEGTSRGPEDDAICPRCRAPSGGSSGSCASCGAPRSAFEIVNAPLAASGTGASTGGSDGGPAHALVRADRCVGCGTCVAACPEEGALRLVNKVATLDLARCRGHGECVQACPVGAIALASGSATQVVEVPDLSVNFESNVLGLYVVGELGGRGLIKNAINEGRLAVEHIATGLAPGVRTSTDGPATFDVVIVGSGPAGLSSALAARRAGLSCVVLEQGTLADSIRKYPRRKLLLAEPVSIPLYGDLWVADATKEALVRVWEQAILRAQLDIRTGERVESVARENGHLDVRVAGRSYRARRVVLAMGRRGTPRRLEVPGEDLDKVFYDIAEMEAFAGQRVLVVGGGDSAIESAVGLANQPDTPVLLSYRGHEFARIKERNRQKLEAAVAEGRVSLRLESVVRRITRDSVVLDRHGEERIEPNDVVVARIGGLPPSTFLEAAGVRTVRRELAAPASTGAQA
jgi:thioredoxin reductase/NAD-dependent dihydropyrimidine dehydrogenase PreA subunit